MQNFEISKNLPSVLKLTFAIAMLVSPSARADFEWVKPELQKWHVDAQTFKEALPSKERAHSTPTAPSRNDKLAFRQSLLSTSNVYSEILGHDRAEEIIDEVVDETGMALPVLERVSDMDAFREGRVTGSAWSDSYWPIYKGALGARYAAPEFPYSNDWAAYQTHAQQSVDPNALSPIEKYELLIGNQSHALREFMWAKGRYYYERDGHVEPWMGICNGWAYATLNLPRPEHSVTVKVLDSAGQPIDMTLLPTDIKALGSFLWSKKKLPIRFIGRRCNGRNPANDENGRPAPEHAECLDTNPGTFHKAIVNQMGLRKRGFVFDAAYDYEVWNYPAQHYRYTYFNPKTRAPADSLADASITREQFAEDPYAAHRAPNTASIVGIAVEFGYVEEIDPPSKEPTSSEASDLRSTVHYIYDLELDAEGRIIGGEWYQNAHPDFMWSRPYGLQPTSSGDFAMQGAWDGLTPIPASWKTAGEISAAQNELLPAVILKLFELSRAPQTPNAP